MNHYQEKPRGIQSEFDSKSKLTRQKSAANFASKPGNGKDPAQLQSIADNYVTEHHPLNADSYKSTSTKQLKSLDSEEQLAPIPVNAEAIYQRFDSSVIQQYPYINSDPPETKDAQIYGIFKMNKGVLGKCVYVGQTTMARAGDRFVEHARDDDWAPWHMDNVDYSSNNTNDWAYAPRTLESLKDVTKFEVTAAEQWWIEHEGGIANLENRVNAMTKDTFNNYKTIDGNYDHTKIQVTKTWKPAK